MEKFNVSRIGLGLFYLIAGVVNLVHTIHNTHYLWSVCLENVHFSFYKEFLEQIVIPNEILIILLVIVFEFIVGILILSKEFFVKIGLSLAILWVLIIAPFLPWVDVFGHLVLGMFQALLLIGNYETTVLEIIQSKISKEHFY
ncbi:MAG: hypothetical protein JSW11_11855 [Candidatus Heimdallarchaeota archaeon]|nr:MAG: hypothetical protein JSW11_11855 [Candidatus Heimdallarchaeota archaeon]